MCARGAPQTCAHLLLRIGKNTCSIPANPFFATYPRSLFTELLFARLAQHEGVVDRDVRRRGRVRCPTTTSRWSAGRRRALTLRARAPRDPHPLNTWVPQICARSHRPIARLVMGASPAQAPWRRRKSGLPDLRRGSSPISKVEPEIGTRSNPSFRGEKENGDIRAPPIKPPENQDAGQRSVELRDEPSQQRPGRTAQTAFDQCRLKLAVDGFELGRLDQLGSARPATECRGPSSFSCARKQGSAYSSGNFGNRS